MLIKYHNHLFNQKEWWKTCIRHYKEEQQALQNNYNPFEKGEEMFVILNEILRGTNSKDKQKGSFALMQQLIRLNANGMIATHDWLLGKLAEELPDTTKTIISKPTSRITNLLSRTK